MRETVWDGRSQLYDEFGRPVVFARPPLVTNEVVEPPPTPVRFENTKIERQNTYAPREREMMLEAPLSPAAFEGRRTSEQMVLDLAGLSPAAKQRLGQRAVLRGVVRVAAAAAALDAMKLERELSTSERDALQASISEKLAEILGVERMMLGREQGFVNRELEHTIECRHAVAGVIRTREIDWIFCPHPEDAHPDHRAATRIIEDARFDAKLTKTTLPGEPRYPSRIIHYFATHLKTIPDPSFLVDTTGLHDRKREAILAYESQFTVNPRNRAVIEWLDAQARFLGSRIGVETAEPFSVVEPLGISGLEGLI